jgi:hypothetical protein
MICGSSIRRLRQQPFVNRKRGPLLRHADDQGLHRAPRQRRSLYLERSGEGDVTVRLPGYPLALSRYGLNEEYPPAGKSRRRLY